MATPTVPQNPEDIVSLIEKGVQEGIAAVKAGLGVTSVGGIAVDPLTAGFLFGAKAFEFFATPGGQKVIDAMLESAKSIDDQLKVWTEQAKAFFSATK